ncbi:MAG: hypothetical protein ACRDZP_08035 [Acidimicrobiales bacterium]
MSDRTVERYPLDEYRIFASVVEGECPGPWQVVGPSELGGVTLKLGHWPAPCPPLERTPDGWAFCRSCGWEYRLTTDPTGDLVFRRRRA